MARGDPDRQHQGALSPAGYFTKARSAHSRASRNPEHQAPEFASLRPRFRGDERRRKAFQSRRTMHEVPIPELEWHVRQRIGAVIRAYEQQGYHRTGTDADRISGDWLAGEGRALGLEPAREDFALSRVDPLGASLAVNGRTIEGLPLFDGTFTTAAGIAGPLGNLDSDAPIGLAELPPNAAEAGALGDARRHNRHQAIVAVTRGALPGFSPSNADSFLRPFGPPVLQVASEEAPYLADCAKQGAKVLLTAHAERTQAQAFNVVTLISGTDKSAAPLVVMTPRSGWWWCASERGGGLACWLEIIRAIRDAGPVRDVLFVGSSGHELGHIGLDAFMARRPGLVPAAKAWIHLGANIGAARGPANNLQASDDAMESTMADAMTRAGLRIDRRLPRGAVPLGEALNVHRGGGRYISIIGRNDLFHNPADRGADVIDLKAIERFARAFSLAAKSLAGV